MNRFKNYIILGLFFVLIVFTLILSIKCSRLEQENMTLKNDNKNIVDSIKTRNKNLESQICVLMGDLEYYKHTVDSLKLVKQKIIVKTEYVISENIICGVKILQENLRQERYY